MGIYFTKNSMDFCEISMLLLLSTYLQVLEMCRVVCFNIMVEKFQLPAVGYLPWPLPTSNFKKIQNSKICTHKIEKIRETATTTIFYPPLVWLSLSRARVNSSVISSSRVVTCITRSSSFILGLRRLAAEEGTFSKKTFAEDLNPGVGELFWARLPGYGQKKPEVPMGAWVSNGLDYYGNLV